MRQTITKVTDLRTGMVHRPRRGPTEAKEEAFTIDIYSRRYWDRWAPNNLVNAIRVTGRADR